MSYGEIGPSGGARMRGSSGGGIHLLNNHGANGNISIAKRRLIINEFGARIYDSLPIHILCSVRFQNRLAGSNYRTSTNARRLNKNIVILLKPYVDQFLNTSKLTEYNIKPVEVYQFVYKKILDGAIPHLSIHQSTIGRIDSCSDVEKMTQELVYEAIVDMYNSR